MTRSILFPPFIFPSIYLNYQEGYSNANRTVLLFILIEIRLKSLYTLSGDMKRVILLQFYVRDHTRDDDGDNKEIFKWKKSHNNLHNISKCLHLNIFFLVLCLTLSYFFFLTRCRTKNFKRLMHTKFYCSAWFRSLTLNRIVIKAENDALYLVY